MEKHVIVRIPGAPGEGYQWVLYPRAEGEPAPAITRVHDSVLKVVTPESTDYVFLSPTPLTYEGEGITFTGCAGAVRVKKTDVTLALTGGPGKVGYKGHILDSAKPVEETLKLAGLKPATRTEKDPVYAMQAEKLPFNAQWMSSTKQGAMSTPDGAFYFVNTPSVTRYEENDVSIQARKAAVVIGRGSVRFIAPAREYVNLSAGNVGVRGMGPFDLTFTDTGITGRVDGDTRTLVTTWPKDVTRPMYRVDGVRWYAGFADDPSIYKGLPTPQLAIALGVTAGSHTVEISEWEYPAMPPSPARAHVN
jgi:hypothetical protein